MSLLLALTAVVACGETFACMPERASINSQVPQ
jgi:hypothetical protein